MSSTKTTRVRFGRWADNTSTIYLRGEDAGLIIRFSSRRLRTGKYCVHLDNGKERDFEGGPARDYGVPHLNVSHEYPTRSGARKAAQRWARENITPTPSDWYATR